MCYVQVWVCVFLFIVCEEIKVERRVKKDNVMKMGETKKKKEKSK